MLAGWLAASGTRGRGVGRSAGRIGYTIFRVITDIKCQKIFALSFRPSTPPRGLLDRLPPPPLNFSPPLSFSCVSTSLSLSLFFRVRSL